MKTTIVKKSAAISSEKLCRVQQWGRKLCREMKEAQALDKKIEAVHSFINLSKIFVNQTSQTIESRKKMLKNREKHLVKIKEKLFPENDR